MSATRIPVRVAVLCVSLLVLLAGLSACGQEGAQESAVQATEELDKVTVEHVQQWMDDGVELAIVDSRSSGSWGSGTTKALGAVRVPSHEVEAHLSEIPRDKRIIVYCT